MTITIFLKLMRQQVFYILIVARSGSVYKTIIITILYKCVRFIINKHHHIRVLHVVVFSVYPIYEQYDYR